MLTDVTLQNSNLGKQVLYESEYNPSLLFPVPRSVKRAEIGIDHQLPFQGFDLWNGYELSWLNAKGKPQVAIAQFFVPCISANIIESKSFKLYLNSFNQTRFDSEEALIKTLQNDLSNVVGETIQIQLFLPNAFTTQTISEFEGTPLDDLDITVTDYNLAPHYLKTSPGSVKETLHSNLLKSNCLVTGQPDWASILIRYEGAPIDQEGLLRYLISFREQQEFHEQCVERIFVDILEHCNPEKLTVFARYTRRGGLDINPFRSNYETLSVTSPHSMCRTARQ